MESLGLSWDGVAGEASMRVVRCLLGLCASISGVQLSLLQSDGSVIGQAMLTVHA